MGLSVHHLISERSLDKLSSRVGRVTALAQCQSLHPRHQAAVRVNCKHTALVRAEERGVLYLEKRVERPQLD